MKSLVWSDSVVFRIALTGKTVGSSLKGNFYLLIKIMPRVITTVIYYINLTTLL